MATITITIQDSVLNRVLDAFATYFNYNVVTDGTKAAFAKKQLIIWATNIVKSTERNTAANTASASVDTDIIIT